MSLISGFRRPAAPEWEPPARPTAGRAAAETAGAAVASLLLYVGVLRFLDPPHPGIQLGTALVAVVLFPLRRRMPAVVLVALAVLAGAAPVAGPVAAGR
ncbi:hypothetical protein [Streptomyces sp. NPDC088348]|uniref:hypothetical protein n=1 Tax=Streptomyces sp. NPDC088348 TaxID=3365853 RepID=UPI0038130408